MTDLGAQVKASEIISEQHPEVQAKNRLIDQEVADRIKEYPGKEDFFLGLGEQAKRHAQTGIAEKGIPDRAPTPEMYSGTDVVAIAPAIEQRLAGSNSAGMKNWYKEYLDRGQTETVTQEWALNNIPAKYLHDGGNITPLGKEVANSIAISEFRNLNRAAYRELFGAEPPVSQTERMALGKRFNVPITREESIGGINKELADQMARKQQQIVSEGGEHAFEVRQFLEGRANSIETVFRRTQDEISNSRLAELGTTSAERGSTVKAGVQESVDKLNTEMDQHYARLKTLQEGKPFAMRPDELSKIQNEVNNVLIDGKVDQKVKYSIEQIAAKYGLIGEKVGVDPRFGNSTIALERTVAYRTPTGGTIEPRIDHIQIAGDVTPLTVNNSEAFRQELNALYPLDTTRATSSVKAALDNAVESTLSSASGSADFVNQAERARRAFIRTKYKLSGDIKALIENKKTGGSKVVDEKVFDKILASEESIKRFRNGVGSSGTKAGERAEAALQVEALDRILGKAYERSTGEGKAIFSFSSTTFEKALNAFGEGKMIAVFNREQLYIIKAMRNLLKITHDLKFSNRSVPAAGAIKFSKMFGSLLGGSTSSTGGLLRTVAAGTATGPAGVAASIGQMLIDMKLTSQAMEGIVDWNLSKSLSAPVKFKTGVAPSMQTKIVNDWINAFQKGVQVFPDLKFLPLVALAQSQSHLQVQTSKPSNSSKTKRNNYGR